MLIEAIEPLRLRLRDDDELVISDNTDDGAVSAIGTGTAAVVSAGKVHSSYYSRNVGAQATHNPWLLFLDADCVPSPDLVDQYFAEPLDERCGAVVGEVIALAAQTGRTPQYAETIGHLRQAEYLRHPYKPFGATANLLVRRDAWIAVDGFAENIRSGGDIDFCWRLQEAGWSLQYAPEAVVEHRHRDNVRALIRQWIGYGAAGSWLNERYANSFPNPWPGRVRPIPRQLAAIVVALVRRRPDDAVRSALDAIVNVSYCIGWFRDNEVKSG